MLVVFLYNVVVTDLCSSCVRRSVAMHELLPLLVRVERRRDAAALAARFVERFRLEFVDDDGDRQLVESALSLAKENVL